MRHKEPAAVLLPNPTKSAKDDDGGNIKFAP
jgi:hypothetical protein